MAITDKKITDGQLSGYGVVSAPDKLTGTAAENKAVFDRLIRMAVAPALNALIEELCGVDGAENIGAQVEGITGGNVALVLTALKQLVDNCHTTARLDGTNLIFSDVNGAQQTVDLSGFVDTYTFHDGETVRLSVSEGEDGIAVTALLKEGSITRAHLAKETTVAIEDAVTAAQTAAKEAQAIAGGDFVTTPTFAEHAQSKENPHAVTCEQIGAATAKEVRELAEGKATTATYTATLTADGWSDSAPYTQTVAVEGILDTDNPITDIVLSDDTDTAMAELEGWSCVSRIVTAEGSIMATCLEEVPTVDMTIQMKVVR